MICRLALLAALVPTVVLCLNGTCLPEAVPASERRRVVIDGVEQPVGILILSWQSASLNGEIFRLLLEEVFGYETVVTARSAVVTSGLWGIAGCQGAVASAAEAQASCELREGHAVSTTHLNFETWDFYLPATLQVLKELYPHRMPVKLGTNLGFQGYSANWVPQEISQAARAQGLYLEFFETYSDSPAAAARFFNTVEEINTTAFFAAASRCPDYAPMNEDLASRDYLRHFPHDPEGVEAYMDSHGALKYRGRCDDGVWWLSPACRANRSQCIPWISVLGYGYLVMQHKAVHYNLSIAMASTDDWVRVIHENRVMSYTWVPDAAFMNRDLKHILFPAYSKEEHNDHLYITEFAHVETEKWGHKDLKSAAPRVWETAVNMEIPRSKLQSILEAEVNRGISSREAACEFLRQERTLWSSWIPDVTQCLMGQGLTVVDGRQSCKWCPRATFSDVHPNISGSRLCRPCAAGRFQEHSEATECLPCPAGSMSAVSGSEHCSRCPVGRFQSSSGMSHCEICPGARTTPFQGAAHQEECVCQAGSYEPLNTECRQANSSCACLSCGEGLTCLQGSRLSDWETKRVGNSSREDGSPLIYPLLQVNYYSDPQEPASVYSCAEGSHCPGGDPGTCATNRTDLVCARCKSGHYNFDGQCIACTDIELGHLLFPIVPILASPALVVVFYSRMLEPFRTRNVDSLKNQALSVGFIVLVLAQTLAVIKESRMRPSASTTVLWEVSSLTTRGLDILRPECAGGGGMISFTGELILYSVLPLVAAFYFAATMVTSWILARAVKASARRSSSGWSVWLSEALEDGMEIPSTFNTYGALMYTFSIAVVSISFKLFKCYGHPNGQSSLLASPDLMCYSDTWNGLAVLGVSAVLIYCVGVMSVFAYVLHISPARFRDEKFRTTWKFLLVKWRPSCWWFGQAFLIKGLLFNLALVVFKHGALQLWWMATTLIVYVVPVLSIHPWRHRFTNAGDVFTSLCMVLIALCALYKTEQVESAVNTFDTFLLVFSIAPLAAVLLALGYLISQSFMGSDPEGEDSVETALFLEEIMMKMSTKGLDNLVTSMASTTRVDRDAVKSALAILSSEVSMQQVPGKPRLIQRSRESTPVCSLTGQTWSCEADAEVRDYCRCIDDVNREVRRVFGGATTLPNKQFRALVASISDDNCADILTGLHDIYDEGTITPDVYRAFLRGIRRNDRGSWRQDSGERLPPIAPPGLPEITVTPAEAVDAARTSFTSLLNQPQDSDVEGSVEAEDAVAVTTDRILIGASRRGSIWGRTIRCEF